MDQREPLRKPPIIGRPRDLSEFEVEVKPAPEPVPDDQPRPRRFARLIPPQTVRRIPPNRLAALAFGVLGGTVLLLWLGSTAVHRLVAYVNTQPAYQVSNREIELVPGVPAWYRGGRQVFLDHVWDGSAEPRTFSALDFDGNHLLTLFKRYPWVKRADRMRRLDYPSRVEVRLEYRSPVALARMADGSRIPIDAEGVVLPREDIDFEVAEPLILLDKFNPPTEFKAGEVWGRLDPRSGVSLPDDRVVGAARLSAFLKPRLGYLSGTLKPPLFVHVMPYGEDGCFLQITCLDSLGDKIIMVCWDEPSAEHSTDAPVRRLAPERKWAMLLDYVRLHQPGRSDPPMRLKFTKDAVAPDARPVEPPAMGRKPGNPRSPSSLR